ncbi:MAG: phosphodiester glycosidase family protein [Clostridia bacterium]|nr:phosphodiester glycosidase family protein [Clostridia bacterium]
MKKRSWGILGFIILLCALYLTPVSAASYVKQAETKVSTTSKKHGWIRHGNDYYYYNSKGKLLWGKIKYKGQYYYSTKDGKRFTGWLKSGGKRYYYNRKNGIMFRGRWATGTKYKYYFNKSGVALANSWLSYQGKRYYFLANSRMATGWQKIGKYRYYFDKKTGALAKNMWVGQYYVNKSGRRTGKTRPDVKLSDTHYTYKSSTLNIDLKRKSTHGVPYWIAVVKISSAGQLKSALSYGTYGGARQTTSSAVSSNGGIIGVNGSAFSYQTGRPSPLGMCIKNGVIYGDYETSYSVMAVKNDGTIYTPKRGLKGKDLLKAGVKDTYNFGPVLIQNGKAQPAWSETAKYYPRTAVGMVKPGQYVLLVTDTGSYSGLNHWDLVNIFNSYGCQYAYNLDGGGSATLYYNGKVMNRLISNYERPCGDFLYFSN